MRMFVFLLLALSVGCTTEYHESAGEHSGEARGDGEESGVELARSETYDRVRNGARLVLAWDESTHSFRGTVTNTTEKTLQRVRVEVHLSNGRELGPTKPGDLAPGASRKVVLTAESHEFAGWTAHAEVGSDEHSGGEHGGEHDRDGGGEHDREGGGEGEGEHR